MGVFDAVTGQAVWTTIDMVPQIQAHVIYVADVSGDNREEIVIYDKADGTIKIFWNEEENSYQPKPDKWDDPLYRRVKQNWNFYSPGHYTMNDYPVISNVTISNITTNGSTIYWETDEASSSQVAYGLTESYGYETDLDTAKTTEHSVRISGVNPDTQYHFQIRSWNVYDKQGIYKDSTFTSDIAKKLIFITPSHTVYQGVVSPVITLEVQDLDGNPRDAYEDVVILLSTDSQAGEFSLDPYNWSADTSVTIYTGTSSAQFYYKDIDTGTPTITATEIPDHGWPDGSQQHTIVIAGSLHEPHLVYGTVKTSGNQVPQDGDLTFQAFIKTRPAEKLTESSAACGYSGGTWWVECANFQSGWTAVEVIQVEFTDSGSGETGDVEVTLTVSTADDAGQVDLSLDSPEITGMTAVGNTQLKLTWTSAPGVSGYNVYRGTTAYFTPDKASGSNRVGSQVNDQDPGTSGVQWTDASNVVGDWQVNYFYVVTSVNING
ncbi:fibronectin type III domain-containing protein, partial [bacterium]|nr:fibronectin type III domain-containing protein [bacterium]